MKLVPIDAEFYMPTKDNLQVSLYYRRKLAKKDENPKMQYFSNYGRGWVDSTEIHIEDFIKNKLVKL